MPQFPASGELAALDSTFASEDALEDAERFIDLGEARKFATRLRSTQVRFALAPHPYEPKLDDAYAGKVARVPTSEAAQLGSAKAAPRLLEAARERDKRTSLTRN